MTPVTVHCTYIAFASNLNRVGVNTSRFLKLQSRIRLCCR